MIDIIVSIKDKEYPFFMKLVENFDFVTVKCQPPVQPDETEEAAQEEPGKTTSPALEGAAMSSQEFTNWIEQAEAMPSVTLQQAKTNGQKTQGASTDYQIKLSDNAVQNIDEVTSYIAVHNHQPMNAVKVGDALFAAIDQIWLRPYHFKQCSLLPTKSKMYRQALCLSWYIIYKIIDAQVTILGIIHVSKKPSKRKALKRVK